MDVLLINPNSRKEDSVEEIPLVTPPINLMYAAQSMENSGYDVSILDSFAMNMGQQEILRHVRQEDPEVVGIPLYSSDLSRMHTLTKMIKDENPERKIFFAGHHATALHKEVMEQFPNVDYLVRGEGEFSSVKLLDAIENESDLSKIKGISYREDKKNFHNPEDNPIGDLDDVAIPNRRFINKKLYHSKMSKRDNVDVIITTRGCPYKCTFCAKLTEDFRSYRERSIPNVIEEMQLIQENGINGLEIYDEIFTIKRKRVMEFIDAVKKEKLDFEFRIRTRATHVDDEMLRGLSKIGCSTISYGVESGNQQILNNIKKETTTKIIEDAFRRTEKNNINVLGFFMIGNKGETPQTIRETIDFAKRLNPLFATFGVLHPYPATMDYVEAKLNKSLQGDYAPFKPMPWIKLPWTKDIKQLYDFSDKAYEEYYKRPKYIAKFIKSSISQSNLNLLTYSLRNFYKRLSRLNGI